ncbi:hypothetical protein C7B61_21640, partial [filamentous cyanobacterium CCP1]
MCIRDRVCRRAPGRKQERRQECRRDPNIRAEIAVAPRGCGRAVGHREEGTAIGGERASAGAILCGLWRHRWQVSSMSPEIRKDGGGWRNRVWPFPLVADGGAVVVLGHAGLDQQSVRMV